MAKSKKLLFEKYIGAKYDLFMQEKVKGEMLGWAGNYFCGYVVEDCTIIPCIWDVFGRCLFGEEHHEKYDLVDKDGFTFMQKDKNETLGKITRVEVIGKEGREFVKLLEDGHYKISMQDDGKTIKLFEKKTN